jgi:hypothetical protein
MSSHAILADYLDRAALAAPNHYPVRAAAGRPPEHDQSSEARHRGASMKFDDIDRMTGGRFGQFDLPCPICAPQRRSAVNRRRTVLRVWRRSPTFITYRCARCDIHGYAREGGSPAPDRAELDKEHNASVLWLLSAHTICLTLPGTLTHQSLAMAGGAFLSFIVILP